MKCFYAFLAVAAAFTLAFSPAVRRFLFYRDWPQTPDEWQPRYRMWNEGVMVYSGSRDDTDDIDDLVYRGVIPE